MKDALKAGTRQSIALRDLDPHPLAQRKFDAAWAAEIGTTFEPAMLGTITVAKTKKGKLWVVDGQHRCKGALQWLDGDASQCVECMVIPVEDDAEAARLFLGLNNHKGVRTLDKFIVRTHAKDAVALGIVAVLGLFGLRVDQTRGAGVVQAVDACESIFGRQRGAQLLERTLRILHATWGKEADAYNGQLIRGLGLLLTKYGTVANDEELVRKLAKRSGPLGLLGRARELKGVTGASIAQSVCECIRIEYNKGRRTDRLDDQAA